MNLTLKTANDLAMELTALDNQTRYIMRNPAATGERCFCIVSDHMLEAWMWENWAPQPAKSKTSLNVQDGLYS
jgi:hypothetical protein